MNDNRLDVEDTEGDERVRAEDDAEQALAEDDERTRAEDDAERALAEDDAEPVREPVDDVTDEQFGEPRADVFDESLADEEAATAYEPPTSEVADYGTASSSIPSSSIPSSSAASPATDPLLASESAEAFMGRWSEVQTSFIEDPHKAVTEADALITEVITAYQQALDQRRARISGAQADGGADTEELRLALLEYRGLLTELLPAGRGVSGT